MWSNGVSLHEATGQRKGSLTYKMWLGHQAVHIQNKHSRLTSYAYIIKKCFPLNMHHRHKGQNFQSRGGGCYCSSPTLKLLGLKKSIKIWPSDLLKKLKPSCFRLFSETGRASKAGLACLLLGRVQILKGVLIGGPTLENIETDYPTSIRVI